MEGLLLVDKPVGWTSFDCVNYIRRIVALGQGLKPKNVKVGHTGTLDPFASGLLVILIGKNYTRKAMQLSKLDKTYQAEIELGTSSTTGDPEGELTTSDNPQHPNQVQVEAALKNFVGQIYQQPPAFSAIKIDGQRAYKLARSGQSVDIPARKVTITSCDLISYSYPRLSITTRVSSGTYIRSLAVDIGKSLDSLAYCRQLRRISIGDFEIYQAVGIKDLTIEQIKDNLKVI